MQFKQSLILLGLGSTVQARSEFKGTYQGNLTAKFAQGKVFYSAYANSTDGVLDVMLCRQTPYFRSQGDFMGNWGLGSQAKFWFDEVPQTIEGQDLVHVQVAEFQGCSAFPQGVAYWNTTAPGSFQVMLTPDCTDPAYQSLSLELVPANASQMPQDCGAYEMNDMSYAAPIIVVMLAASAGVTYAIAKNRAKLAADEKQMPMVDVVAERKTSEVPAGPQ